MLKSREVAVLILWITLCRAFFHDHFNGSTPVTVK
jgi:hypothetical protein